MLSITFIFIFSSNSLRDKDNYLLLSWSHGELYCSLIILDQETFGQEMQHLCIFLTLAICTENHYIQIYSIIINIPSMAMSTNGLVRWL